MQNKTLRFISAKEAAKALSMNEAITLMRDAFSQLSSGNLTIPQRVHIDIPENNGTALFMPAYSPELDTFGIKTASIFHDNLSENLPTVHALVVLMDAANGKPLAIIDGEHLTALRTGAASGLATDLLARKDSETVAVFGAGVQGRTQLEAICNVRNIKRCLLFDKLKETARDFEKDMSRVLEIYIEMPDSLGALRDADIICTATNSLDPVFADSDVGDGTHINAIGSYTPDMSEIPPSTLARSKIVVGSRSACLSEAGDILKAIELGAITESNIYAELGEIVDQNKDGRITEREITLFKSVGNAIQDLVCADQILKNANSKMLGIQLEL